MGCLIGEQGGSVGAWGGLEGYIWDVFRVHMCVRASCCFQPGTFSGRTRFGPIVLKRCSGGYVVYLFWLRLNTCAYTHSARSICLS